MENKNIVESQPPRSAHKYDHRALIVVYAFSSAMGLFLLISLSALIGPKAAFIALFVILGFSSLAIPASTGHKRYLHHQDKKHDH